MPKAPAPTAPSAEPMPRSSSESASREGTSSPSGVLCESVREVVKPNAPTLSASMVRRRISAMSSKVAGSQRVPHRLSVIVRVHVDPARRDQQSVGIDLAPRRTLLAADRSDAAARDRHVAAERRLSSAVNDGAAANDDVVHGSLPG